MLKLQTMFDWLREFSNSKIGLLLGFVSLLSWIIGVIVYFYKKAKKADHKTKGWALIVVILLIGLVIPVIILFFSNWSSTIQVVLNVLAIVCLFSFVGLLYIIRTMNALVKRRSKTTNTEEATIHLRSTHTFFNGDLHVHLLDEKFYGNPIGHKMTARIWSPGHDEITIKDRGVGFSVIYESDSRYRIRITKTSLVEATFQVIRN
jgi:uncharacterized membrane protein